MIFPVFFALEYEVASPHRLPGGNYVEWMGETFGLDTILLVTLWSQCHGRQGQGRLPHSERASDAGFFYGCWFSSRLLRTFTKKVPIPTHPLGRERQPVPNTAEAVACRLAAYPPADPLLNVPPPSKYKAGSSATALFFLPSRMDRSSSGPGARLRTRILPPILVQQECCGVNEVERAKKVVVTTLLQLMLQLLQ